jgi:hypothetical protein
MTTTQKVTVWYDSTSADHGWIVDIDDGESTRTIRVFDDESEARDFAARFAAERGLPLA